MRRETNRAVIATLLKAGRRDLAEGYVVGQAFDALIGARVSSEPYQRALDRIQTLIDRGVDVEKHTLLRLKKTANLDKIEGIYQAAMHAGLGRVAQEAKKKFRSATGKNPLDWK